MSSSLPTLLFNHWKHLPACVPSNCYVNSTTFHFPAIIPYCAALERETLYCFLTEYLYNRAYKGLFSYRPFCNELSNKITVRAHISDLISIMTVSYHSRLYSAITSLITR